MALGTRKIASQATRVLAAERDPLANGLAS
jgi:hypothetical protein